jgi:hypothetical protein
MSRSKWYRRVAGLALALGLLHLPAAHAAPAGRSVRNEDPAGVQQLERVVRSFFRPIANILSVFQMGSWPPGGGDPPKDKPQEGVGIDPNGRPPGQPPGQP